MDYFMVAKMTSYPSDSFKASSIGVAPYSYTKWWLRPRTHDRLPLYWHLISRAFALAMWAIPRRYRFSAALRLARVSNPIVRRLPWYRARRELRIDGVSEIALYHALEIMSNSGALFDPVLDVEGAEIFYNALSSDQGVLVTAPHALLNLLVPRNLYDAGYIPTVISSSSSIHLYGTRLFAHTIRPSPTFMIRLRSVLRSGGVVCAMVDGRHATKQKLIQFPTVEGPMYISDAMFRLALRCNARILFVSVRVDQRRGLLLTVAEPATSPCLTVETITSDCIAFIQAHIAAVASSAGK
jgi:hypothetical protein